MAFASVATGNPEQIQSAPETRWQSRDVWVGSSLFLLTAAFTLYQNTRVAVLWDITFLLDTAWRFALHQVPYRDLPFPYAPLTFFLHAALIRLFGRTYLPHVVYAAVAAGASTVLAWRLLLRWTRGNTESGEQAWKISGLLSLPLIVLSIHGVYPHPIYDSDTILAVLVSLALLTREPKERSRSFAAGAGCVLPLFFKQNIGLPFLLVTAAAVAVVGLVRRGRGLEAAAQAWVLAGAAAALATGLLVLQITVGLHNYLYWTITFAAQRRLPGLQVVLSAYREPWLLWTLPFAIAGLVLLRTRRLSATVWAWPTAVLLLTAPFLWTLAALARTADPDDRADQLLSLWPHVLLLSAAYAIWSIRPWQRERSVSLKPFLPIILLAVVHGTFLSQQLWGSTYAIWPLLVLLIGLLLAQVRAVALPVAAVVSATLLVCGGLYALSHERLDYVHLDGQLAHSALPALGGMATPGPWLPAFDELVRVTAAEIPREDAILIVPEEDPFYFATGRTPRFPILLVDPASDPYTPQQMAEQARAHDVRWLIVGTNLQLTGPPHPELPVIIAALLPDFVPYRTIPNYAIYRRR